MGVCRIQGCDLATSGYSIYCDGHKRRNRRHGHPSQQAVTNRELEPFRERIRERIAKNSSSSAWPILKERWATILAHADSQVARYQAGTPLNRYEIDAWSSLVKIGASATDMEVIETALALYLQQEDNPYRFKSDKAFGGQLVRRVRALAPSNAGTYYDHRSRSNKKVYRDAKPKTIEILADVLQQTFGVAGVSVARLEQQEINKKRSEQQALHDALSGLV